MTLLVYLGSIYYNIRMRHSRAFSISKLLLKLNLIEKIKSLQTDWGGEFCRVSSCLASHWITHNISCPYTPPKNGRVERKNRHVVEMGISLLAHSNLPLSFWSFAFQMTIYLINRLLTPIPTSKSPYQMLDNNLPDYQLLKVFGCVCFPCRRSYNSHKLQFRQSKCIFIGYSSNHKGYLCLDPLYGLVYVSRHVVFNEAEFPCSKSNFSFGTIKNVVQIFSYSLHLRFPFL